MVLTIGWRAILSDDLAGIFGGVMLKSVVAICVVGTVVLNANIVVVTAAIVVGKVTSFNWVEGSMVLVSVVISAAVDSLAVGTVIAIDNAGSLVFGVDVVNISAGTDNPTGIAL